MDFNLAGRIGALGGRRQGDAALRLASSGGGGRLLRLDFEVDAEADQCGNEQSANCAGEDASGVSSARLHDCGGAGGGRAGGLQGGVLLTNAADDGPHRARVGVAFDV
eukprot:scaffold89791_cov50-Phaeocystis_antarctica.AAC.2